MMGRWKKVRFGDMRLPPWAAGRFVLITIIFLCCLIYFSPTVGTYWWHLHHGNVIEFKGHYLRVPLEWVAQVEPQNVQLVKWHGTILSGHPIDGSISFHSSIYLRGPRQDEIEGSWEAHFWAGQTNTDNVVSGPFKIPSNAGQVMCMESLGMKSLDNASADCLILESQIDASFAGEKRDLNILFWMIGEIK
jgi:hypothetical protein